jgi:hypothetical protein
MKSTDFWVITPCITKRVLRFGGTHHLHIQGRNVSQERNQQEQAAISALSAGFSLGLHFDLEDGGDTFLLNLGLSLNYTALQPRRP